MVTFISIGPCVPALASYQQMTHNTEELRVFKGNGDKYENTRKWLLILLLKSKPNARLLDLGRAVAISEV